MALDQFVNTVKTLSRQGSYSELCDFLHKQNDILVGNPGQLDDVYESLDPSLHTLACFAVLAAKLQQENVEDWDLLLARIYTLIAESNDEQMRFSSHILSELCHLLGSELVKYGIPIRGIALVSKAIRKIQTAPRSLTTAHSDLAKLCLAAKCFGPALEFLEEDITSICMDNNQFDAVYLLLYYYYGGCIYTALKEYDKALFFFEVAVTCPSGAVSHIMLEAHKKYLLLSLLVSGERAKDSGLLPRYTSAVVSKFLKPLCMPYFDIWRAFQRNNSTELVAITNKYEELLKNDNNWGLVQQVVRAQIRTNIKKLTKTFITLSLSDVASRVGLETPSQAEKEIVQMIQEGSIHATVSQQDGMVRFDLNPESFSNPEMLKLVQDTLNNTIVLDKQVQKLTEEVMLSFQYVKKMAGVKEEDDERLSSNSAVSSGVAKVPGYSM